MARKKSRSSIGSLLRDIEKGGPLGDVFKGPVPEGVSEEIFRTSGITRRPPSAQAEAEAQRKADQRAQELARQQAEARRLEVQRKAEELARRKAQQEQARQERLQNLAQRRLRNIEEGRRELAGFTPVEASAIRGEGARQIRGEAKERGVDISSEVRERKFIGELKRESEESQVEVERKAVKETEAKQFEILDRTKADEGRPVPRRETIGGEIIPGAVPRQAPKVEARFLDVVASPVDLSFEVSRDLGKVAEDVATFSKIKGIPTTTPKTIIPRKETISESDIGKVIFPEKEIRVGSPKDIGRAVELGAGIGALAFLPTPLLSAGFVGAGTKRAISPETTTLEKVVGLGEVGLGAFVGVRGASRFLREPIIKIEPIRPTKTPIFEEKAVRVVKGGREFRVAEFEIKGEIKPPELLIAERRGTLILKDVQKKIGITPSKKVLFAEILPAKRFDIKTLEPVIDERAFAVTEVRGGSKIGRLSLIKGESDVFNALKISELTKTERFATQRLLEQRIGKPIKLERISKFIPKDEELGRAFIQTEKIAKLKPIGKKVIFEPRGRRIQRAEAISEFQPLLKTDLIKITKVQTFFKDVTKPFSRAIGKTPKLRGTIMELRKPIILEDISQIAVTPSGLTVPKIPKVPKRFKPSIPEQAQKVRQELIPLIKPPKLLPKLLPQIQRIRRAPTIRRAPIISGRQRLASRTSITSTPTITQKDLQISRTIPKLKPALKEKEILRTIQLPKVKALTKTLQPQKIKQQTKQVQKQAQKLLQKQAQKQIQKQKFRFGLPSLRFRTKPPKVRAPTILPPIILPPLIKAPRVSKKKKKKGILKEDIAFSEGFIAKTLGFMPRLIKLKDIEKGLREKPLTIRRAPIIQRAPTITRIKRIRRAPIITR